MKQNLLLTNFYEKSWVLYFAGYAFKKVVTLNKCVDMSIHPQYTFDKDGKAVGVFISIDEWEQVADSLNVELPDWQKKD